MLDCCSVYYVGELLGALCVRKGPGIYVACQEEILKNVGDNLERRLPDLMDVAEGLLQKFTSEKRGAGDDLVSVICSHITIIIIVPSPNCHHYHQ